MEFTFGYGKGNIRFSVCDRNCMQVLHQNRLDPQFTGTQEVMRALASPIGTETLRSFVKPGEKVAIVTSDITRPVPSDKILPPVIRELTDAGVRHEDIFIILALGSHRPHTPDEQKKIVGEEIFGQIRCIDSDPNDTLHLGTTRRGTPVDIFRPAAQADRVICIGNIEYHYFAGYSGGVKAIMPGISTREAIQANHSAMTQEGARAGEMDHNPVRQDIEEVTNFFSVDFIVNVILDENRQIVKAVAGHPVLAHREGCRFLDSLYKIEIQERADIVIASPGGFPKDINLYQAQKALDNAKNAVRDGGIVILAAACSEGLGEHVFARWFSEASCVEDLVKRIQQRFELGGHKAAAIAMVLKRAGIFLVSDLEDDFVRSLFMEPFHSVEEALAAAYARLGSAAGVIVMPHGGSTLPVLASSAHV